MKKMVIGTSNHQIGNLFTLALVAVFAILALFVAVLGIEDYQSVLDVTAANNDARVSCGYIANKVRTSDGPGNVWIDEFDGQKLLVLRQVEDDGHYTSCIYYYDGMLREQPYDLADDDFMLEDGTGLVSVSAFDLTMDERGLIYVNVTTNDGQVHGMYLAVRGFEKAGEAEL